MSALRIYSTRYSRGAIVKLAESLADDKPLAKFILQRHEGRFLVKVGSIGLGTFDTEDEAIECAERECERILLSLGGGDGPR